MATYSNDVCIAPGSDVVQAIPVSYTSSEEESLSTSGSEVTYPYVYGDLPETPLEPQEAPKPKKKSELKLEIPFIIQEVKPPEVKSKIRTRFSKTIMSQKRVRGQAALETLLDIQAKERDAKTIEHRHETLLKVLMEQVKAPYDFESELLGGRIDNGLAVPFLLDNQVGITCFSDESQFRVEQYKGRPGGLRVINFHPMTLIQNGLEQYVLNDLQLLGIGMIL